ncbi:peroxidase 24 [Andrographis paniculata]|uniref:peroxidase 24 n=1 Tax=Andrographis paniculata TaxID=175694 RepID=UPI0021E9A922|nr:peroxidase 24 [Andrographis paniculata]
MMRGVFLGFILIFASVAAVVGRNHGLKQKHNSIPSENNRGKERGGLRPNYYAANGCPQAERLVRQVTWEKVRNDATLGAKLLRLHYHDCFVTGCDGSILLDTVVGKNQSEKDAGPNLSLGGFDVIDAIKDRVEEECPGIVSCADILALAARDAILFSVRRPLWNVLTGRKDSKISLLSNVAGNLPSPFSNFSTLLNIFSNNGLDFTDLVALSGAHTIGVAHCGAISRRLFNFTGRGDADPSLDPSYAAELRRQCPNPADRATTVDMDPDTPSEFDPNYFAAVAQNKGLFQSDAALLTNQASAALVRRLQSPAAFFSQFSDSMEKMGRIAGDANVAGEVRQNCRRVN